jgi:hypothetical protein
MFGFGRVAALLGNVASHEIAGYIIRMPAGKFGEFGESPGELLLLGGANRKYP